MPSVRNHLSEFHEKAASHHAALHEHFTELSKCLGKSDTEASAKATLGKIAAEHQSQSAYHERACKDCAKAEHADLEKRGNEIVPPPPGLTRIAPDHILVPRFGQPPRPEDTRKNLEALPLDLQRVFEKSEND